MTERSAPLAPRSTILYHVLNAPTYLSAFMLFLLMLMTFSDVILRSVFNNPIEAATELTRLSMAIMVFGALPMVSWKSQHIVVDLMDPLFSAKLARFRDIIIDLSCGVLLFWPASRVFALAERARGFGDVTEYLGLPQFYIGWFISVFAFITGATFVLKGVMRMVMPEKVSS